MRDIKFDFDDILIEPVSISDVESRSQVNLFDENGMLPIFTSPMFDVVNEDNIGKFVENNIYGIYPRSPFNKDSVRISQQKEKFVAYGLDEFIYHFIEKDVTNLLQGNQKFYALIDIANGHMSKLVKAIRNARKKYENKMVLMVGNIANPETYHILSDAGADFVRISIGSGSACLTSEQTAIGYPVASLIEDCHNTSLKINNPAKIVADGGLRKYSDIIKALALGADYVMLGGMLNKILESASPCIYNSEKIIYKKAKELFKQGTPIYKNYRGMSSKSVQKELGNEIIKTSEGIEKNNRVENTLSGWVENFTHYLRSSMSYCGKTNLKDYIGRVPYNFISQNAFKRYNK